MSIAADHDTVDRMPEFLGPFTEGPMLYLIVAGLVMADAVFPLAPSETLLVAGGVLAAGGEVAVVPLMVAGAVGALAGHLLLYSIGASAGSRLLARAGQTEKGRHRIRRATEEIHHRPWLVVVADFIPWGRTILMSVAGATGLGFRRFTALAATGAVLWATMFVSLGLIGGSVFESTWQSLGLSLAVVILIGLSMEIAQRRSKPRESPGAIEQSDGSSFVPTCCPTRGLETVAALAVDAPQTGPKTCSPS